MAVHVSEPGKSTSMLTAVALLSMDRYKELGFVKYFLFGTALLPPLYNLLWHVEGGGLLPVSINMQVSFTWSRLFNGNGFRGTLLPCYSSIKMRLESNARLIISCLEGLFPSVPSTRISHYSLIQKDAGLRTVHSAGSCAVGRAPDLHTESRCGAMLPSPPSAIDRRMAMSQLGILTLDLQLKAFLRLELSVP